MEVAPLVGMHIGNAIWRTIWRFPPPSKLKIDPPYDPAILLPGIHPKEAKTLIRKDVCTPVLTAAPFTTTSVATDRWRVKQSQCSVVNDATAGIHSAVQRPARSREPTPRVLVARRVFSRLTVFTRDAGRSFIVRGTFHSVCKSDRHAGHLTLRSRRDVKYFSVTRGKTSLIRISF